jgi:hypothetical protein
VGGLAGGSQGDADYPSGEFDALFLVWAKEADARIVLDANPEKFGPGCEIDAIPLRKWNGPYTAQLVEQNAALLLDSRAALHGLKVSSSELCRDLRQAAT